MEGLRETLSHDLIDSGLSTRLVDLLNEKLLNRESFFAPLPQQPETIDGSPNEYALILLELFSRATLEQTFFDIHVDSSLSEADFVVMFQEIAAVAQKLQGSEATVVVFLDGTFL